MGGPKAGPALQMRVFSAMWCQAGADRGSMGVKPLVTQIRWICWFIDVSVFECPCILCKCGSMGGMSAIYEVVGNGGVLVKIV